MKHVLGFGAAIFASMLSVTANAQQLELAHSNVTLGDSNALVQNWVLREFHQTIDKTSPEVTLAELNRQTPESGAVQFAFDHPDFAYLNKVKGKWRREASTWVWEFEDQNVKLSRSVVPDADNRLLNVNFRVKFKTEKHPNFFFVLLKSHSPEKDPEERDRQLMFYSNKEIERFHLKDNLDLREYQGALKWIAASSRYFLIAVLPAGNQQPKALIQPQGPRSAQVALVYPVSGSEFTTDYKVFFGAKDLNLLRSVDPSLDATVDFGFFTFIAYPILRMMKWLYGLLANYGVAIILLTVIIKLVTFPLNYKSMKSMKEMQRLQPKIKALQERHKNDREALNREMLTLMRTHGYNPLAGCLPILIQMPVFFALYQVLYSAVELYQAPFALWIHDLSARDPYYVTPVILTVTMFLQQKLTPTQPGVDPAQQKIMQFMPVMFGALMVTLPSGLTLYMLVNALVSIVQQVALNKKFAASHPAVV